MTPWGGQRTARRLAAGVAVALLMGTASAASTPVRPRPERGDLAASAQADADDPTVLDEAVRTTWPGDRGAQADAVSTASATCSGCHARAVTVQVVLADRGWHWSADADNVATAWATCRDCTAQAVAVQLVLVRRAALLEVNNRAMAVTAGCSGCAVDAVAYQLVVQAGATRADSGALEQRLLTWARTQPAPSLAPLPGARTARRQPQDRLATLESAVVDLVGGSVLRSSVVSRRSG